MLNAFAVLVALSTSGQVPEAFVEVPRPPLVVNQPPKVTVEEQPPLVIERPPIYRVQPQPPKVVEQEPVRVPVYQQPEVQFYEYDLPVVVGGQVYLGRSGSLFGKNKTVYREKIKVKGGGFRIFGN